MDSRQLKVFVALAENLHFAKTADQLNIAQSALSAHIRKLESDLGVRLLNRNKRSTVSLTDAGTMFLHEATLALRQLERAELMGKLAARGEVGSISLGYIGSAVSAGVLPRVLKTFRDQHSHVEMHVSWMETPRQLESLRDGGLDIGLLRSRSQYPDGVAATVLMREQLMIAVRTSHPLATSTSVLARDFREEPFIVPQFSESEGFTDNLANLGRRGGFDAVPRHRVADFISGLCMAAAGYGVVLAPQSMSSLAPAGVTFRKVEDLNEDVELALAFRTRDRAPCVRKFIECALSLYSPKLP